MATRIACANSNFTTAATWASVDSTSLIDSELGTQVIGTSNIDSPTFSWGSGAPTVDGIAIKVSSRMVTPGANTITISIRVSGGAEVKAVTLNVSDIDNSFGWYLVTFAATALSNSTNYIIRCVASVASAVTLYRSTTGTTNFSKMLRTTTTGAPAAGDQLLVLGEYTAAATKTDRSVTMNNNTTDVWGGLVATYPQALVIGKGGTLTWTYDAGTQFYLAGIARVCTGGTMSIGTSAHPIGAVTAAYKFAATANLDSGLIVDGTFNAYGASKATVATLLTTNAAASQKVLGVASTSGWAPADVLALAPTTTTASQHESRIIDTVDSATQVTVTVNLTSAHGGTAPTQGEVINLTRNLSMFGVSTTVGGYIQFTTAAVVNMQYVEVYYVGGNAANKYGIVIQTTTGSAAISYCSVHDCTVAISRAFHLSGSAVSNVTLTYNVTYNIASAHYYVDATSGSWTIDHCVGIMANTTTVGIFYLLDNGGTFTNNTAAGNLGNSVAGIELTESAALGTFEHNTSHSNAQSGIRVLGSMSGTLHGCSCWRNATMGLVFSGCTFTGEVLVDGGNFFGNANAASVQINSCTGVYKFTLKSVVSNGDSTFATPYGLYLGATSVFMGGIILDSCDFSTPSGILVAHSSSDIYPNPSTYAVIRAANTKFGATTIVGDPTNFIQMSPWQRSGLWSMKHQTTAGNHQRFLGMGRARTDTAIYNNSSPSERLIPTSASVKFEASARQKKVDNGGTVTCSVYVRKSKTADGGTDPTGANYNGAEPRLILRANLAAGIATDTVLDTMTAAVGNWEQLTGTSAAVSDDAVLEAFVDCDGTAGWVNVDDWS